MSRSKKFAKKILLPDLRTLYFAVLIFWGLLAVFAAILLSLKNDQVQIFTYVWLVIPVSFGAYFLYGYGRLFILRMMAVKANGEKFFDLIKIDKKFRSIFTTTAGILVSVSFAGLYVVKGFMASSGFYWFLAEFYLVASILQLYLNTIIEAGYSKNEDGVYILVYRMSVLLAVAIAGATFYVVFFDGIFEKSVYLITFIAMFTLYKFGSAIYSFHKSRITLARLDTAKSLVALASALFSIYTLCVALMIMITQNPVMKHFAYLGFGCAIVTFVLAIIGLIKSCISYVNAKKQMVE